MSITNRFSVLAAILLVTLPAWAARSVTVPSGTQIVVRTNDAINAKTAAVGTRYSAVVDQDVLDSSGRVAISKGSDATLAIRQIEKGNNDLVLGIESMTVNGAQYNVSTDANVETGRKNGVGKNSRTAKMVGGGAALGTIIGAIAGHGKGAAIGAVSGAAAGAAAETLTRGKEIRIPAESVLSFRLDQPLTVHANARASGGSQ